ETLRGQLSDNPLSRALTHVVITSYDMTHDTPVLFSSRPLATAITDVSMIDVARATSAGPTYFEPVQLRQDERNLALVDGGVCVNNPAVLGLLLAPTDRPLLLVSLGTGVRDPGSPRSVADVKDANWAEVALMVMNAAMTGGGQLVDSVIRSFASTQGRP